MNLERQQDLESLDKKELVDRVKELELRLEIGDDFTKKDIILRISDLVGLDRESDLMNTSDEYNIGLRKSGWLKLYRGLLDSQE